MSKGGNILVKTVDEKSEPITNSKIKLIANHSWNWISKSDDFGECLFKNIPNHLRSVFVDLIGSDDSNTLARSGRFKVKPGITTTVIVNRASSKLIVRFSKSINKSSIYVQAFVPNESSNQVSYRRTDFLKTSNDYVSTDRFS